MDIEQSLRAALQPVLDQLAAIEREIEQKQAEIAELRQQASRARKIAQLIDPVSQSTVKRQPGPKRVNVVKAETVEMIWAYLVEHVPNGDSFSVPQLLEDGFDLRSDNTLARALEQLADQGRIRLDSVGGPQSNTRKNYKLVA